MRFLLASETEHQGRQAENLACCQEEGDGDGDGRRNGAEVPSELQPKKASRVSNGGSKQPGLGEQFLRGRARELPRVPGQGKHMQDVGQHPKENDQKRKRKVTVICEQRPWCCAMVTTLVGSVLFYVV